MKIIKASKASSGRMRGAGIIIEFYCDEVYNVGDVVSINYDGRIRYFKISELKATADDSASYLYYTAEEYGYYTIMKGKIDLRELINLDLTLVTDEERLNELSQESRFC
jgi:hypothetical protein